MPRGRGHGVAVALLAAALVALTPGSASAHAGLVSSDPIAGAELGAAPTQIGLTFSEAPEPSLAEVSVSGDDGQPVEVGAPEAVPEDPLSLSVPVPALGRGVYTVEYRIVSGIDGHATEGTFAFGVGASPAGVATATTTDSESGSAFELVARWALLLGLVALVGGAVAGLARFGGREGSDLALAAAGWALALLGLVLLGAAQRSLAGSSLGELLDTPVGGALIWRGVALVVAGAGLLVAWRAPRMRRLGLLVAALGALAAIIVHVEAGHAGAGSWSETLTVSVQVAHFAAAGVWFGGLAALVLGIRGAPAPEAAASIRRFAVAAAIALIVVLVTGIVRTFDELSSWGELLDSGYGLAVLAKLALIALIAVLAFRNRRRAATTTGSDLDPLRRTSRRELVLAVIALGVAALLGTLAPPVEGQASSTTGLSAEGTDVATTVRVELETASNQPGPNSFDARIEDYDTGDPVDAERVSLTFTPIDDPGVEPSTLELEEREAGDYSATGPNLTFDGRWEVVMLIERGTDSVEVPLELDLPIPDQFISKKAIPGEAPEYTMQTASGYIRLSAHPEQAGPSKLFVTVFTQFEAEADVDDFVLTIAVADGPVTPVPMRRVGSGRFEADVELEAGPTTIVVVARASDDVRLRGRFELNVPPG